ncbi:cation:dicarboxylate symporter family transporter [Legionella dresdenensis]|uniref:Cation:dicarboxylate symporter family transporter n=1 Tax=Legionella dresdenensis TaxID=450200 RepID=A0ABV8CDR2_9GAMM
MSTVLLKKLKFLLTLLAVLLLPLFFGQYVPLEVKSISYALSLSMKSVLEFVLPFIIFSFVFSCLGNLRKGALFFVVLLIVCVFASNFTALMVGFGSGYLGLSFYHFMPSAMETSPQLAPAWQFHLTKLISNDIALLIGFFSGIFFSVYPNDTAKKIGAKLNSIANGFLRKVFIPFLPLFILGFVFKLEYEHILQKSLNLYGPILLLIVGSQWIYLLCWYFVAGNFSWQKFTYYLRNVLPATLTGFSTISSAAAMPVLLMSTEKNLEDEEKARMLVPAIINIHTIGSAIAMPILSLATMLTFGMPMPSLSMILTFAFYTALAKYAVAAVPGGVILVVTPLLEAHLGFSSDMIGLITAVYLICDPFGTAANVTGNGVFPIMFTRLKEKLEQTRLVGLPSGKTAAVGK